MNELDYQDKLVALAALGIDICLRMRAPNDWYVSCSGVETQERGSGVLVGSYGNGRTPQEAILDHWRVLVDDLPKDSYLVLGAHGKARREVRWDGAHWALLTVATP